VDRQSRRRTHEDGVKRNPDCKWSYTTADASSWAFRVVVESRDGSHPMQQRLADSLNGGLLGIEWAAQEVGYSEPAQVKTPLGWTKHTGISCT
jgi:hypothetical protein